MTNQYIPDPLMYSRVTLCDVILGRAWRILAGEIFDTALAMDANDDIPRKAVTIVIERAARWERMAEITETGIITWGNRINRCGLPEPPDEG